MASNLARASPPQPWPPAALLWPPPALASLQGFSWARERGSTLPIAALNLHAQVFNAFIDLVGMLQAF